MLNYTKKMSFTNHSKDLKDNMKNFLFDTFVILIGLMISSFGTALFYSASLGSSPMATLCDGIHIILHMSYGNANTLANILLLVVLFLLQRSYINVGTLLCVFAIGPFINLFTALLAGFPIAQWMIGVRIFITILGTLLMAVGLGMYVAVDRGFGALEGLVKFVCTKKQLTYTKVKILQDIFLVLGGILLGATWGIGTFVAMFLTGPVLQFSIRFFTLRIKPIKRDLLKVI